MDNIKNKPVQLVEIKVKDEEDGIVLAEAVTDYHGKFILVQRVEQSV